MKMGEDSIPKFLWKEIRRIGRRRNGQVLQVMEEEVRDITVSSPAIQESQQMTPPTPAPSKDRFFMDWSSIRTRSPPVRMLPQNILVRERGQEINQTTIPTSQPGSEPTQMGVTDNTPHEDLPSTTSLA